MKTIDTSGNVIVNPDLTKGWLWPDKIWHPELDDWEDAQRYIPYTEAELAERARTQDAASEENTLLDLMADHEYRLCMLELENGGNE